MTIIKTSTLAAIAGIFLVTACTDINTPSGDPNLRTKEGAAVGAATGALFGILRGNSGKDTRNRALRGAIIGGGIGAFAGSQLDKQAAELEASFGDARIEIINNGDELIVRMPQDILFAIDSTAIRGGLRSDLAVLAGNLDRYPGSTVVVYGHTDNTGSALHNQSLSQRRADAVSAVLIADGVSAGRIRSIGRGEDQPIASNLNADGRARNRRVEIVIRPNA